MAKPYKVTAPRAVLDVAPGDILEHDFTEQEEADLLAAGRLQVEPREFDVIGPTRVFDTEPGGTFKAALTLGQEAALLDAGHVELLALQVLDQGEGAAVAVHVADDGGDLDELRVDRGEEAALAGDEPVPVARGADEDGLDHAVLAHGVGELSSKKPKAKAETKPTAATNTTKES